MKSNVLILFASQQQGLIGSLVRLQSSQAETLVQKHKSVDIIILPNFNFSTLIKRLHAYERYILITGFLIFFVVSTKNFTSRFSELKRKSLPYCTRKAERSRRVPKTIWR